MQCGRCCLLAGGTGLAPFLSMLDGWSPNPAASVPILLIYGVTTNADLVEVERLAGLGSAQLPTFTFSDLRRRPGQRASAARATSPTTCGPRHFNDGDVDVYLCGPPPMVEASGSGCEAKALAPASFYYEKFASANEASRT